MGGVAPAAEPIATPCIGVCRVEGRRCAGCGRTLDEIAGWPTMTPAARAAIMRDLPGRRRTA